MRTNRVYVDMPLAPASLVTLGGSAAAHVSRVLRLQPGDPLTVFNGRGGEYEARIDGLRKDTALLEIGAHRAVERESPLSITLAQGVSRGERMDLVVQKATELGVRGIVPLLTERSVVRLDKKQAEAKRRHWHAVAVSACEQCGRNRVPEVAVPMDLAKFLALASARSSDSTGPSGRAGPSVSAADGGSPDPTFDPAAARVVLSPHGGLSGRELRPDAGLIVLIGPEGGLSATELEAALAAGFRALRLGPRILRTETAAIAALAVIQHQLGDL